MSVIVGEAVYDILQLEETPTGPNLFRVATETDVKKLASAIVQALKAREAVVLRAIGAGCVNTMYKALTEAHNRLSTETIPVKLLIEPSWATVAGDLGSPVSAVEAVPVYLVERRHGGRQ